MRFALSTSSHLQSGLPWFHFCPWMKADTSCRACQLPFPTVLYPRSRHFHDNVTSANTNHRASPAPAHFWTWGCGNSLDSFLIHRACDRLGAYYITALKSENSNLNHETQTQFPGWSLWVLLENPQAQLPSFARSLAMNYIYRTVITLLKSRKALRFLWSCCECTSVCCLSHLLSKLLKLLNSHLLAWEFGTWFRWNHVTNSYFSILDSSWELKVPWAKQM